MHGRLRCYKLYHLLALLIALGLMVGCGSPVPVPSPASEIPPTPASAERLTSRIDDLVTALAQQDHFSGSVLVAQDDKLLISKGYGYGWIVGEHLKHRVVWHRGGIEGFRSEIDRYPDDGVTIIVLSNREDAPLDDTGHLATASGIAKLIFEEP